MPRKTAPTLGLYVTEKHDGEWYHVTAYPVTIGPTLDELRQVDLTGEPHHVPHDRIRNFASWDHDGRIDFYNLMIVSQGDNHHRDERRLYGFGVEYREPFSVDLRQAARMHTTLTTITRRMEKIANTYGHPNTFGAYLAHAAAAIGATAIVQTQDRASSYDDRSHRISTIKDGTYAVDRMIERWRQAGHPEERIA
jgi:hypothetical protein